MIYEVDTYEEFKDYASSRPGFLLAPWCGDTACEEKIKAETGLKSRCIPFVQDRRARKCVCCGKDAVCRLYFGKQY